MLHGVTCERYKAGPGTSQKIPSKTFKKVEINVANDLRKEYPVPANVSPIISDIQSESASLKHDGKYTSCGTRTVHRLYLATAFTTPREVMQSLLGSGRSGFDGCGHKARSNPHGTSARRE
jgi:hypothetical protein